MSDASKFPIPTQTLRYQVEALRGKDEQEKLAVLLHIADLVEENDTVKEAALGSGLTTAISESVQASSISTAEQQQVSAGIAFFDNFLPISCLLCLTMSKHPCSRINITARDIDHSAAATKPVISSAISRQAYCVNAMPS